MFHWRFYLRCLSLISCVGVQKSLIAEWYCANEGRQQPSLEEGHQTREEAGVKAFEMFVRDELCQKVEESIGREELLIPYWSIVTFSLPSLWRAMDFFIIREYRPAALCVGFVFISNHWLFHMVRIQHGWIDSLFPLSVVSSLRRIGTMQRQRCSKTVLELVIQGASVLFPAVWCWGLWWMVYQNRGSIPLGVSLAITFLVAAPVVVLNRLLYRTSLG